MKYFLFTLLLLGSSFQLFAQVDGENLFDDTFLHEIRFTSVDTNTYITTKDYQTADVTIDGQTVVSIGIKRKGNISGYPETNKFPFKVKTNKYVPGQEYDGIREFMLHMNYQDPTMLRAKLTYDICAEMGLYSLRTAFAKVYLDDVYWGLYTIIEGKDEMYKHVFDNRDADAMESTDFGGMCYNGPDQSDYYFEPGDFYYYDNDNGENDRAWSRFITMLDKVNNTPNASYIDTAGAYLNLEDFFRYQAINVYLLNMDSYIGFTGNQRYVYDTIQNIWQVTPWDFNASFGLWDTNNATVTDYPLLPQFACFGRKIQEIDALKMYYFDAMCELTNTVMDPTRMNARIDELKAQIQDAVYEDTRKVVTNEDFDAGTEFGYNELFFENQPALKTVVLERYNLITAGLVGEDFTCTSSIGEGISSESTSVLVYPNPTNHLINFKAEWLIDQTVSVTVIDGTGREVMSNNLDGNTLDVSRLKTGVYFCMIKGDNRVEVVKFLKE